MSADMSRDAVQERSYLLLLDPDEVEQLRTEAMAGTLDNFTFTVNGAAPDVRVELVFDCPVITFNTGRFASKAFLLVPCDDEPGRTRRIDVFQVVIDLWSGEGEAVYVPLDSRRAEEMYSLLMQLPGYLS